MTYSIRKAVQEDDMKDLDMKFSETMETDT